MNGVLYRQKLLIKNLQNTLMAIYKDTRNKGNNE